MKQKNLNILIGSIAFTIVFVIVAGIGSSWFTNKKFSTWFNSWGKGNQQIEQPSDLDKSDGKSDEPGGKQDDTENKGDGSGNSGIVSGGGTVSDVTNGNGIKLVNSLIPVEKYSDYGIERTVVSAYTVTATIEPEQTTAKDLVWSVNWADKDDGVWVNETKGAVTDYVTLNANGLSATVALKKAFGTQIILTVASKNYRNVSATATFDYIQRGSFYDIDASSSLAIYLNFAPSDTDSNAVTSYTLMPDFGTGSVQGNFEIKSAKIQFSEGVWYPYDSDVTAASDEYSKRFNTPGGITTGITYNTDSIDVNNLTNKDMKGTFVFPYLNFFTITGNGGAPITACPSCEPYLKNYLIKLSSYSNITKWGTVTFTGSYSYGDYYSTDFTFNVGISKWLTSSLIVPPSDVDVDNDSFYF